MLTQEAVTSIKDSAMPALRRLVASCEGRSAITGEPLSLTLLPSQVAIRGMMLARSTSNSEMSALRAMLNGITAGSDDPNRQEIIDQHDWLGGARVSSLGEAMSEAAMPPSSYASVAQQYARAFRKGVRGRSLDGLSDEELLRQVSGVRREAPVKVRNRENKSLLWRDYLTIMMDLSEHDPEEAMTRLIETGEFSPGVARVMIGALYLTGIRPIEVFGINLYVPRTDLRYTDDKRNLGRLSPISAIHDGLVRPIAQEVKGTGMTRGQYVVQSARMTGSAPILSIMSAKQQNANKDLRFPVRFLLLDEISATDANLLAWATEFRNMNASENVRRRLSTQCAAILRTITASDPEMRQDITLYTFRHSFASRARASLEEHECSALTGHTAVRTFRGYGERAPKVKGRGWLPTPDPERANMIQQIWNGLVISPEAVEAVHAMNTVVQPDVSVEPASVEVIPEKSPERDAGKAIETSSPAEHAASPARGDEQAQPADGRDEHRIT